MDVTSYIRNFFYKVNMILSEKRPHLTTKKTGIVKRTRTEACKNNVEIADI